VHGGSHRVSLAAHFIDTCRAGVKSGSCFFDSSQRDVSFSSQGGDPCRSGDHGKHSAKRPGRYDLRGDCGSRSLRNGFMCHARHCRSRKPGGASRCTKSAWRSFRSSPTLQWRTGRALRNCFASPVRPSPRRRRRRSLPCRDFHSLGYTAFPLVTPNRPSCNARARIESPLRPLGFAMAPALLSSTISRLNSRQSL
jgi:hypothetical protein